MRRNWMLIALLVVAIILLFLLMFQFIKHSNDGCNYNSPNKSYIKTAPNCVINFMCTKDRTAFRDSCGCGCALTP